MPDFPPLETFGRRIMICGPSNAGKSTLAAALARRLSIPAIHLDVLHHLPHSNWVRRPTSEFEALHAEAIAEDAWAMDGNYSRLWPTRLSRATGIILLRQGRMASLARYFRRTLFQSQRHGALPGAQDSLKWRMVHWILVGSPRQLANYPGTLSAAGLPYLEVNGMSELKRLYVAWGLTRD